MVDGYEVTEIEKETQPRWIGRSARDAKNFGEAADWFPFSTLQLM
jgi:hypothetical protein